MNYEPYQAEMARTEDVEAGQYLATPFRFDEKRGAINDTLLNGCLHLPNLFPLPLTEYERRVAVSSWLTDPRNMFWEVWYKQNVVGLMGVTNITIGLDAKAHMAFFDKQLLGRRWLVLTMMGWCFRELGLERLSVEVPEHLTPLVRFCITKLGFRFEGESLSTNHVVVQRLEKLRINGPGRWVAKFGSRREHMHWDGTEWRDIVCLRILRGEFEAIGK